MITKTTRYARRHDWRYLTPEDVAAVRRALRWRWVPTALWLLVAALAVAMMVAVCWPEALVWMEEMWSLEFGMRNVECGVRSLECGVWSAECGMLNDSALRTPNSAFCAAAVLPEWLVWPLGSVVVAVLGFYAAFRMFDPPVKKGEPVLGEAYADDDGDAEEEGWQRELRAFFSARGALITDKQARQIRALCAPAHRMDLVFLDSWLRREMGLRFFMTSLMEIQSICARGAAGGVS